MENFAYFANLAGEIPEMPQDSIISRTIQTTGDEKAVLFGFAAGQELTEHTSTHSAYLYIVQGEAELTLGDESRAAQAGTLVYMRPKLPHSVYARTPVVMLLIMIRPRDA